MCMRTAFHSKYEVAMLSHYAFACCFNMSFIW